MEAGFKIIIFDPVVDKEWSDYMTEIHISEEKLFSECYPSEIIVDETEKGEPILEPTPSESPEVTKQKVLSNLSEFPDLGLAYGDCRGSFSFRIEMNAYNFFGDAASIDRYFLPRLSRGIFQMEKKFQSKGIILTYYGNYYGHIWYFTTDQYPEFCGLYGMKSSLVNLLFRLSCHKVSHRAGIAKRIINDGVLPLAKSQGRKRIVVPWPLPPMIPILNSLGFIEHNTTDNTPERLFLSGMTSTVNYFTLDL